MHGSIKSKLGKAAKTAAAVLFWLLVWHIAALRLAKPVLLPGPAAVAGALARLCGQRAFWGAIGFSFAHIALGFFAAAFAGIVFAVLAANLPIAAALLTPPLEVMRAAPVASFTILLLLWVRGQNLGAYIAFCMVLPIIYSNVLQGLRQTNPQMLEMAKIFRLPALKKALYIYLPAVLPYFLSACTAGIGLAFKSGIAAEMIAMASGTVGGELYYAKLYLATAELFAWTGVVVAFSMLTERLFAQLINFAAKKDERGGVGADKV